MRSAIIPLLLLLATSAFAADTASSQAAQAAARWVSSTAVTSSDGATWPADPNDPKSVNDTLYAGTPGPVLFLLEAYRYTGNREFLTKARTGADALAASLPKEEGTGLYEGIAGIGFTLGEAWLVTHDRKYRDAALTSVKLLEQRAHKAGNGVEWSDVTDIIGGSSGTGLFLLWAARELNAPGARDLAIADGKRLIELGQDQGNGKRKWMMDSKFPREMPNFSHGTAGVAYFLATLYQETHDKQFLDAALGGAYYLISIAEVDRDACIIYHDNQNKKLYYLSWCHGPAGLARLFYRLYQVTGDASWMDWTKKAARGVVASGAPERVVSPGEWNNISACCGTTGQAQFFLDMYQLTHEAQYKALAQKSTELLLKKMTSDDHGARWVQAETRVKPDELAAQTGLMQGAAGVGLWLLHYDAYMRGKRLGVITLPDNPFVY